MEGRASRSGEVQAMTDYDDGRKLPAGLACEACADARRCFALGYSQPGNTLCYFWPSRFRPPQQLYPPKKDEQ
jgi:hypothetical protein